MNGIGIDLGGTKIAGAVFTENGEMKHNELCYIKHKQAEDVGLTLIEQIKLLFNFCKDNDLPVNGCGISVPGIYYANRGTVWAPNIPGWDNYPLLQKIKSTPELRPLNVKIDSDRACYILGETWLGKAQGCRHAIFIAVGTGIGAGILINGQILRGCQDIAGAVGWLALDRPYHEKYKPYGCFEYHASGDGIARIARELLNDDKHYRGTLTSKALMEITAHDLFDAYKFGDPIAAKVFDICIEFWGMTVANLVSIFNPEKIIFGGGVFGPAAQFLNRIKAEARYWAQPISINQVEIEVTALGDKAGLIGAGRLALSLTD